MRKGRMNYRLEVLRRETQRTRTNAVTETFVPVKTIWAERVKIRGDIVNEAGDFFTDYHAVFNIDYAHRDLIKDGWHVRQVGGYEYVVTSTVADRSTGMVTVNCERYNA